MINYTNTSTIGQTSSIVFKTNKNDVSGHWSVSSDEIQQLYDGLSLKVMLNKAANKTENFFSIVNSKGQRIGNETIVYFSEGVKLTNKHVSKNSVIDLTYLNLDSGNGWFINAPIVQHITIEPATVTLNSSVTNQGHITIINNAPDPNYTPQGHITMILEDPKEGEIGDVVTEASALPYVENNEDNGLIENLVFTKAGKKKIRATFEGKGVKFIHEGTSINVTANPHIHETSN